jgi:hypothetical protein
MPPKVTPGIGNESDAEFPNRIQPPSAISCGRGELSLPFQKFSQTEETDTPSLDENEQKKNVELFTDRAPGRGGF